MAEWNYNKIEIGKAEFADKVHPAFWTLNPLFDKKSGIIDETVHPLFYKGLSPVIFFPYNAQGTSTMGFRYSYNQTGGLATTQSGFNPPNGDSGKPTPAPSEPAWDFLTQDNVGLNAQKDHLKGETQCFFSQLALAEINNQNTDSQLEQTYLLWTPTGYGAINNMPGTPGTPALDIASTDGNPWISTAPGENGSTDLSTLGKTLKTLLNDDQILGNLHPLQMKIILIPKASLILVFVPPSHMVPAIPLPLSYSTQIISRSDYASTAPKQFVIQKGEYKGKMALPYSPYYLNANKEAFGRWCWVQQSRLLNDDGDRDYAFPDLNSLVDALVKLPPAQQFLAQVSAFSLEDSIGSSKFTTAYYLIYPLAYYEGYKKCAEQEPNDAIPEASKSEQNFLFLNLSGEEVDVFVKEKNGDFSGPISQDSVCDRNTYLTTEFYSNASNTTFKVTKKGNKDEVIGLYQAVDNTDLHDYHVTIIIEPAEK